MGLFDIFRRSASAGARRDDADDSAEDGTGVEDSGAGRADDRAEADGAEPQTEAEGQEETDEEELYAKSAPLDRAELGPWDSAEGAPEQNRLDLGALRVPVRDGMQVRLDAEEKTGRILAVTLVHGGGAVQLQAFAAPSGEGLWNLVRGQIRENVTTKGGVVEDLYSELGPELLTKIPAGTKDGRVMARVVRFAGVDGPRWFLRGMFSGKAVTDEGVREELVQIFRGAIVNRGTDARPPRDLLILTPPRQPEGSAAPQAGAQDDIDPFERGPEITEIR